MCIFFIPFFKIPSYQTIFQKNKTVEESKPEKLEEANSKQEIAVAQGQSIEAGNNSEETSEGDAQKSSIEDDNAFVL